MNIGEGIHLTGRLQSREYTKLIDGVETRRIAYEISIMTLLQGEE